MTTGPFRVEVCGGIASGKTTLGALGIAAGYSVLLEDFHENPFWRAFYADPKRHAFETEVTFLLQHYHAVRAQRGPAPLICDFAFILDRSYADVTLDASAREGFEAVYQYVADHVGSPDFLIYLRCSARTELARIRRRARTPEAGIEEGYLTALKAAVERRVEAACTQNISMLCIDSERQDFANDSNTRGDLVALLRDLISYFASRSA